MARPSTFHRAAQLPSSTRGTRRPVPRDVPDEGCGCCDCDASYCCVGFTVVVGASLFTAALVVMLRDEPEVSFAHADERREAENACRLHAFVAPRAGLSGILPAPQCVSRRKQIAQSTVLWSRNPRRRRSADQLGVTTYEEVASHGDAVASRQASDAFVDRALVAAAPTYWGGAASTGSFAALQESQRIWSVPTVDDMRRTAARLRVAGQVSVCDVAINAATDRVWDQVVGTAATEQPQRCARHVPWSLIGASGFPAPTAMLREWRATYCSVPSRLIRTGRRTLPAHPADMSYTVTHAASGESIASTTAQHSSEVLVLYPSTAMWEWDYLVREVLEPAVVDMDRRDAALVGSAPPPTRPTLSPGNASIRIVSYGWGSGQRWWGAQLLESVEAAAAASVGVALRVAWVMQPHFVTCEETRRFMQMLHARYCVAGCGIPDRSDRTKQKAMRLVSIMLSDEEAAGVCESAAIASMSTAFMRQYHHSRYRDITTEGRTAKAPPPTNRLVGPFGSAMVLGIAKGTFGGEVAGLWQTSQTSPPVSASQRILAWAFVGTQKSDRKTMLNILKTLTPFHAVVSDVGRDGEPVPLRKRLLGTSWSFDNGTQPSLVAALYRSAVFVPVTRGHRTLDCFRAYEASRAGAIPVVVASSLDEIMATFGYMLGFEGRLPPGWVYARSYEHARAQMQALLADAVALDRRQLLVMHFYRTSVAMTRAVVTYGLFG